MRLLFALIGLFGFSLSATAASEWLYYKEYPWVYDAKSEDWLYLRGAADGSIYAYRNSTKEWEEFTAQKVEHTWDEKYEEWVQNPEPYGGLSVLQEIKEAKDSGATKLYLSRNNISDLSPLAGLTNLTVLGLYHNNISDLTPLAGLTNLTELYLVDNNITDLTPLAGLTNLTRLELDRNNITDLNPLAGLTNLARLNLFDNNISDLTPLAGLTNLWWHLQLSYNNITDITPLAGLTNLTGLYLGGNNISDLTPLAGLMNLTDLFLNENNISDLSPLAGLTNLGYLNLWGNNISDLSPLHGLTNLTALWLLENPITDSQKAMLGTALWNTTISWPDVIIDDSVETEKTWDEQYEEWIQNPEPYGGLSVLKWIKVAKEESGYTELGFVDSNITDLSPLAELTNLKTLWLDNNNISDLSPLAGLTNLEWLALSQNNISDLAPLAGLTNLKRLTLWNNNISDITPLAGLTNLQALSLSKNNISDLTPLAGLTNLTQLYLSENNISDLTPLAGLTNLEWVYLESSNISDITPLAGLTNLRNLFLGNNNISFSQAAMLSEALPNTGISWPDVIIDDSEPAEKPSSTHTVQLNNGVSLEMIWVEPGTFTMGSPETEDGRLTNETQHEVTLTQGFYLGKYEVTQAQYEAVMNGNDDGLSPTPSHSNGYPDRPVEQVSWNDVQVFLERLNEQAAESLPTGWAYVLPTEAQWEYACRAGTTTVYSWGDAITSIHANYNSNIGRTADVGQYIANPWGFFDMHGNVWELTADAWGSYATGAQTDPFNVGTSGSSRVNRGGSWSLTGTLLRSARRNSITPSHRSSSIGFRVGFQQQ